METRSAVAIDQDAAESRISEILFELRGCCEGMAQCVRPLQYLSQFHWRAAKFLLDGLAYLLV